MNKNEKLQSHKLFLDRDILDKWNNNRYEIYTSPNKAIGVVILGEAHQRQQREQMDFIEAVKPTYLLHESQGGWIYDPKSKRFTKPRGRLFDNVGDNVNVATVTTRRFQEQSSRLGFKIIGCDLTNAEILEVGKKLCILFPQQYRYVEGQNSIRRIDDNYRLLSFEELAKDKNIMFYRDKHMVKTITKYEALSGKPIVAIMGGSHGNNIHEAILRKKKFGYAYVKQYAGKLS
ncbi:MAG: hypothetical protein Q8P29_01625 [Candidatus Levybacteria bacterium]|nr:hypothetical protein [Candidatus Levybacteria bacterium]MDZ4228151.1 hypothetical protein [Candidatus Levybacteria bacterium]